MRVIRSWLEPVRVSRGMTQAQVAKRLGVTEAYYSMIESGRRQTEMRLPFAVKLSAVLGVPIAKIVEYETKEEKTV